MKTEKVNVVELFEKYRKVINTDKKHRLSSWGITTPEFERYIIEEGYGKALVEFLDARNIVDITDGEFDLIKRKRKEKNDVDYYKFTYKRNDGKLFNCNFCIEYGQYDEFMTEVELKTKTVEYYK